MRRWLCLVALLAAGCGSKVVGDKCSKEGEVVCATDVVILRCEGGAYQDAGRCPDGLACGSDPTADDDVWCGKLPNTIAAAPEGKSCKESGSTAFACSSTDPKHEVKCVGGVWAVQKTCSGVCGQTSVGSVGCVSGSGGSTGTSGGSGSTGGTSGSSDAGPT